MIKAETNWCSHKINESSSVTDIQFLCKFMPGSYCTVWDKSFSTNSLSVLTNFGEIDQHIHFSSAWLLKSRILGCITYKQIFFLNLTSLTTLVTWNCSFSQEYYLTYKMLKF